MLEDYSIERAVSGRAKCKDCFNTIRLNDIRMKETKRGFYGRPESAFYCKRCSISIIKDELQEQKRIYDELRNQLEGEKENV